MENTAKIQDEEALRVKIEEFLGEEITKFLLKGVGWCNNAYYVETRKGGKYIVKQERADKDGGKEPNDLLVEASVIQQLYKLDLSVSVPTVVFVSENPKMYGYEYIEGEMLKDVWEILSEEEKVTICHALGRFHAEIGKKISKEMAEKSGIKINRSTDVHPEDVQHYHTLLASADVPQTYKQLVKEARTIFEGTMDKVTFQFIHNDAHHENIIIKEKKVRGIIDFGSAEYGEIAKEFSRYIRDFPDHFQHIVSSYEEESGNKLSYERLVSNALLSGFIDIIINYRKGGEDRIKAEKSIATYERLIYEGTKN